MWMYALAMAGSPGWQLVAQKGALDVAFCNSHRVRVCCMQAWQPLLPDYGMMLWAIIHPTYIELLSACAPDIVWASARVLHYYNIMTPFSRLEDMSLQDDIPAESVVPPAVD
jgi:hypothetical protein